MALRHAAFRINPQNYWLALYTWSRAERKVETRLKESGHDVYLPIRSVQKQWSDRRVTVEEPLFGSYLFVRPSSTSLRDVESCPGVVRILRYGGKLARVHDSEIEGIRRTLAAFPTSVMREYLQRGDEVRITGGPLEGIHGFVKHWGRDHRVVIQVEAIQKGVEVEISPDCLERVLKAKRKRSVPA